MFWLKNNFDPEALRYRSKRFNNVIYQIRSFNHLVQGGPIISFDRSFRRYSVLGLGKATIRDELLKPVYELSKKILVHISAGKTIYKVRKI